MKSFGDTSGSQVDTAAFEVETNWMSIKEAVDQVFTVLSANKAETKFGWKYFLHVVVNGDEDAVEYTISVSAQSAIYAQLESIFEAEGQAAFPFKATVKSLGRTYQLADPEERVKPKRPAGVPSKSNTGQSPF